MVRLIRTEQLIDDQSNLFKERNLSQFSRFLDTSPSFVTYYRVDGINSTAEIGTKSIMNYVSPNSPVIYNKVYDMPLYALEVIDGQISFDIDTGTTTEYEGTGLALQSIYQPLPGDHFVIPAFNPGIIFMVSDVNTRSVRGEDHQTFTYTLVPTSRLELIEKQVREEYNTIFRNIGTVDKVIIRKDEYYLLGECIQTYSDIVESYLSEFYDDEIAYLRTPEFVDEECNIGHATCKYLIKFLMDNQIIYFDSILKAVFAFENPLPFESKHNKIYSREFPITQLIKGKLSRDKNYWVMFANLPLSLFKEIADIRMIQAVDFEAIEDNSKPVNWAMSEVLLKREFVNAILDKDYSVMSPMGKVICKTYHNDYINLDEYKEIIDDYDVDDIFRMFMIPYILYGLTIKIRSLQNKTTGTPNRRELFK